MDRSLPVELRWMAIITLKQGVDKYWRKTANKYSLKNPKEENYADLCAALYRKPRSSTSAPA